MSAPRFDIFGPIDTEPAPRIYHTTVRAHPRRVRGEPPTSGAALRDAALAKLAAAPSAKLALAYVRAKLADLYRSRAATWPAHQTPYVNADDADRLLREWSECPPEIHAKGNQNWRGSIFRGKCWRLTGTSQPALRKHMHGTTIPGWRYVDGSPDHS